MRSPSRAGEPPSRLSGALLRVQVGTWEDPSVHELHNRCAANDSSQALSRVPFSTQQWL